MINDKNLKLNSLNNLFFPQRDHDTFVKNFDLSQNLVMDSCQSVSLFRDFSNCSRAVLHPTFYERLCDRAFQLKTIIVRDPYR